MFEVIGIGDIIKDDGSTWGMNGPRPKPVDKPIDFGGILKPAQPKLP